jgi:hypothetical protein
MIKDDLTGKTFGQLTAIEYRPGNHQEGGRWLCKCSCGIEHAAHASNLKKGQVKSCGHHKGVRSKSNGPRWEGFGDIGLTYWSSLKRNALARGTVFSIEIAYAWGLFLGQNKRCALSGILLSFGDNRKDLSRNASLDRIDNTKGYVEGNIQWVHKDVNKMKQHFANDYFIETCKKVAETHG